MQDATLGARAHNLVQIDTMFARKAAHRRAGVNALEGFANG